MEWRETKEGSTTYHELWEGTTILGTAWATESGRARWVDQHGVVWGSSTLERAKMQAEEAAKQRIRIEVA